MYIYIYVSLCVCIYIYVDRSPLVESGRGYYIPFSVHGMDQLPILNHAGGIQPHGWMRLLTIGPF